MSRPTSLSPGLPTPPAVPSAPTGAAPASAAERDKLAQLAAEFESMLVLEMIKTMRQSMLDEEAGGEGLGADTFSSTFDTELSRHLSGAGLGLQQYILDAWDRQQRTLTPTAAAAPAAVSPVAPPRDPRVATATAAVAAPSMSGAAHGHDVVPASAVTTPAAPGASAAHHGNHEAFELELAGRVSSPYGWRRDPFNGRAKFHGGIDLAARYGTEVPAAAEGKVVTAEEQGAYGLTVVVQHRDGFQTRYAHLSAIDVRVGETVGKGAMLGRVGSTGRSTAPHLHFEVLQGGQRIDPDQFVRNLAGDIKGQ